MGLFEQKIRQFPQIIEWVRTLNIGPLKEFLFCNSTNNLFVASGGSYSAAAFAELLSVEHGTLAKALTPLLYGGSRYSEIPAKTLLISASGNNNDIRRAFALCHEQKAQSVAALILSDKSELQKEMLQANYPSFSYNITTGKDGFLSTNTVLALYLILYRAFGHNNIDSLSTELLSDEADEINHFIQTLKATPCNEVSARETTFLNLGSIDNFIILYGAKSYPIALDMESKFSEGAIAGVQYVDYRNFAHGRYNWFTQRPGQTGLICLQHPDDIILSEETIALLPKDIPALRLRSNHTSLLGCIDLLIKEHYLCSALGKRWGLNLSTPTIPDYGRILHRK